MQLSSLDLSGNSLKLHNPSLTNLVQSLTELQELDLSQVDISSSVPHFLANFPSLRSIRLVNCLLQNEFPAAILELPKFKHLSVAYNSELTGSLPAFRNNSLLEHVDLAYTGFYGLVPESISNLSHLTLLALSGCSFTGRIPGSLPNLTQLTALGLGGNKFTGFVPSLVSLSKLRVLELSGNKFEKGRLPKWVGKLTELNTLHVNDMNIKGEIPHILANLTKLSVVGMGTNYLTGHIPFWLFNLTQLTDLNLQQNQLQGPISSSFSNFKSLRRLSLNSNNFSGRVDLDLFLRLNKLENLGLGYNMISLVDTDNYTTTTLPELKQLRLSACNLKEFLAFLRFQNKMEVLFLSSNKIHGLVPVWIWNNSIETLQAIDLSENSITGFHDNPQFLPWRRLQIFFIEYNQVQRQLPVTAETTIVYTAANNNLNGEIPPSICELKSLLVLDLSSNYMSGALPSCLGSLSNSLVYLVLRQNNFQGKMMDLFTHESMLENIDLSENRFTGQLPRSLTNCTNLEVLSLGDNSFDDVFPSWLGTLSKLQVLVLRSNKFYGPIQGSTTVSSQFPTLRIIDLSNNRFSGQLNRKYFQTWNAMRSVNGGESSALESDMTFKSFKVTGTYTMTIIHKGVRTKYQKILTIFTAIDLSCNHFEGEIPLSLEDLRELEALNLSNNHFTGRILPSFSYLRNLESLDLSRNELSGLIPQQLMQLNFLSIFNVSFNLLNGHIPQGQQFDTFDNDSYLGNPRLCGKPLSNECRDPKVSKLPPASNTSDESLLPSEIIDWVFVICGVGSGLIVGIVIGNILYERYGDRSTKRKDRWVRPLRNTRRRN